MVLLDTSVLVAAFSRDVHTHRAEALLAEPNVWIVSDWAAAEFSAAIRLKCRQGLVGVDALDLLETGFDQWRDALGFPCPIEPVDIGGARRLVRRHSTLRAPDALHIAVALRLGAEFATFDERQADVARLEGVGLWTS